MKEKRASLLVFLFSSMLLFSATFYTHTWNQKGSNATIVWDAMGYYLYLPSLFYDDLEHLDKTAYIMDTYAPTSSFYQAVKQPNGNYIMKYSSGLAVMYLPAFAAGHVWAKIFGYKADGFSLPYQVAVNFWGIIVAIIGLWYSRKILLLYFSDAVTAITLLVLILTTNYSFYVYFGGVSTHNYLFTVYTLIVYCSIRWHQRSNYGYSMALGLLCGLAALTRPTDIICVLIPLLWGITSVHSIKAKVTLMIQQLPKLVLFAISAIAIGSIQLIYWKIYSGHWLYYSYEDQGFSWLHPHIIDGMFSTQKGWFMYTPVMIFSLIGFVPLYRNQKQLFWQTLLFVLVALYITFAWDIWWYGGSFSQRAVVQYYAVLVLPLAAFVQMVYAGRIGSIIITTLFVLFTGLNIFMDWQVHNGIMESEIMNRAYYWRIFLNTSVTLNDRKLLDDPDELPKRLEPSLVLIGSSDFASDTMAIACPADTAIKVLQIDRHHMVGAELDVPIKPPTAKGWYRVYARVFYPYKEWDQWRQPELHVLLSNNGKTVREQKIRPMRVSSENSWSNMYWDIKIPSHAQVDLVKVYTQNMEGIDKVIWVADYKVTYTPED